VESGEKVIVGVNHFTTDESHPIELLVVDEGVGEAQRRHLSEVRAGRDAAATETVLGRLRAAARGEENLMPPILQAVEALATVGEISDCLRGVFGLYRESVGL
jgi:methylmalonyl-CoA mutase N-terminal domain/subunit